MQKNNKRSVRNNNRKTRRNNRKTRRNNRKTRRNNRNPRTYKKGGTNYDKVNCCMCGKEVDKSDTLVPQSCSRINFEKAHRICSQCWWNPETGFARENASHRCPGCSKNLPLTMVPTKVPYKEPEIVDLTLEDD
jgi:hypothetical protein